jgi:hypothetical protein
VLERPGERYLLSGGASTELTDPDGELPHDEREKAALRGVGKHAATLGTTADGACSETPC